MGTKLVLMIALNFIEKQPVDCLGWHYFGHGLKWSQRDWWISQARAAIKRLDKEASNDQTN